MGLCTPILAELVGGILCSNNPEGNLALLRQRTAPLLLWPFDEPAAYEDLESGERIPVVPEAVRERYRALVTAHIETLGRVLGENRIDYGLFDTSKPLDHALASFLTRRERMMRVR